MQTLVEGMKRPQDLTANSAFTPSESSCAEIAHRGFRWPEWTAIATYAAVVAFAIPYHEPWADEAQSWQLARSLSLPALFQTYIRYEGSPGLWHFLLWILIRLHVSYSGLHWICGATAVAATSLLVFKSPLPRYLRLLLPFTYFLLFQYAVIARSYVLVPIFLYLIALRWKKSPLVLALLLGLLANVALHAAAISGGLAIAYLIGRVRERDDHQRDRLQLMVGVPALLCLWAFALWTAWPPKDLLARVNLITGQSRPILLWGPISLLWGMSPSWLLSIAFWIAIVVCLRSRRSLFVQLPVLFFAVLSGAVEFEWWHVGLLMPLVICLLWITWPMQNGKVPIPETLGRIALVVIAAVQILWSCYAVGFDHRDAFSPDLAAARFLRPYVHQGATIAVTSFDDPGCGACRAVGILPYFDHNIFINLPEPFWLWSSQNPWRALFDKALPTHPDLVVVEMRTHRPDDALDLRNPTIQSLSRDGYSFTNMFCGAWPEGLKIAEKSCHLIFRRSGIR